MIPIIIAGVVLAAAGTVVYRKLNSSTVEPVPQPPAVSLGRFAIWGRPNSGKTTFLTQLFGEPVDPTIKKSTTARTVYRNVLVHNGRYKIDEIVDMPGNDDRRADWLAVVRSHEKIFYLINFANEKPAYLASVRADLFDTVEAIRKSPAPGRRLHIIATHMDESPLKDADPAEVNNILQADANFRRLYESTGDVGGYVYAVNMTDRSSFERLLESIVKDVDA